MSIENVFLCSDPVFLVTFAFAYPNDKFIVRGTGLVDVFKSDKHVKSIKSLNHVTDKFDRVSKKDVLKLYSYDTESYEYLSKHWFFL